MKYCPSCKSSELEYDQVKRFTCPQCNWEYFQNTAAAVAGFLEYEGKVLTIRRNQDPGKGMLDFPGGFVDPEESAEHALIRELTEELYICPTNLTYLGSWPNKYKYKDILYNTCDFFFIIPLDGIKFDVDKTEISELVWQSKEELNPDEFSFDSMKKAIQAYQKIN